MLWVHALISSPRAWDPPVSKPCSVGCIPCPHSVAVQLLSTTHRSHHPNNNFALPIFQLAQKGWGFIPHQKEIFLETFGFCHNRKPFLIIFNGEKTRPSWTECSPRGASYLVDVSCCHRGLQSLAAAVLYPISSIAVSEIPHERVNGEWTYNQPQYRQLKTTPHLHYTPSIL